jgi:hypothetical protein
MAIVGNIAMGVMMLIIMLSLLSLLAAVIYPPVVNHFFNK